MNQQVLIIDAHPVFIHKTAGFLKGLTINQIQLAVSGHEGIALADALAPELVILSGTLPDMDSRDVCRRLKEMNADTKIIVQIGLFTSDQTMAEFKDVGADEVIDRKEKDCLPFQQAILKLIAS